jgi:hypothetical protein
MKSLIKYFLFQGMILLSLSVTAQNAPFEIMIAPIAFDGLGGIQSYSIGQHDGQWLIVGGRLDGLHRRQPWAAFDIAGHNNQLIVIDPVAKRKWSAPLTSLPTSVQEHLSSTNMEFYQEGDYLYCFGGYGYSESLGDHTTFDLLTAINVPEVIAAVQNGNAFTDHFRQLTDSLFQVTGGKLKKINDTYYLLGGQKFIGRYNPMGPDHGPGFTQEYTNSIRKFNLTDNGITISVDHLPSHIDEENLHRRDYNAEAQILPSGEEGITMFSGVFQQQVDLPFLNSVTVDSTSYEVNNSFQQYYNHYHCPVLPFYSATNNEMHTVFFGGIAQFYDEAGTLMQDDNVPFVNTIARVTRNSDGEMAEFKLPIEMPALLGSGAEFIPSLSFPHFQNKVFKLDELTTDSVLIGHIFGGISSSGANIFFTNDGTQSNASSQIFEVYVRLPLSVSTDALNQSSTSPLDLKVYPNPNKHELNISFNLPRKQRVTLSIFDAQGTLMESERLRHLHVGENVYQKSLDHLESGNVYLITLTTPTEKVTRKIIIAD